MKAVTYRNIILGVQQQLSLRIILQQRLILQHKILKVNGFDQVRFTLQETQFEFSKTKV